MEVARQRDDIHRIGGTTKGARRGLPVIEIQTENAADQRDRTSRVGGEFQFKVLFVEPQGHGHVHTRRHGHRLVTGHVTLDGERSISRKRSRIEQGINQRQRSGGVQERNFEFALAE